MFAPPTAIYTHGPGLTISIDPAIVLSMCMLSFISCDSVWSFLSGRELVQGFIVCLSRVRGEG
jgi:hypothetical protein